MIEQCKYLLDTCTISYLFRKNISVINHMKNIRPKYLAISVITAHEIEYGLMLDINREKKLRTVFESLIKQIKIIDLNEEIAKRAAIIRSDLKKSGNMIGAYDIFIAATAVVYQLTCVTSNVREFSRVKDLIVEDWYQNN
ncbi:MAG: type II toxin-antitoxin system VapC family toxin [Rickettsiales bacterium]|nr:MAG: type II toxin-antitoxin system VapC family toxin [Rickettsiales bacterium]